MQTHRLHTNTRGREVIRKRGADDEGVPPGQLRPASHYDPVARWAAKGEDLFWMGYKVHLTETCGTPAEAGVPAAPNLITDVFTTDATVPRCEGDRVGSTAPGRARVRPGEHCLGSGCPSADLITAALKRGTRMVTPVLLDHLAQAKAATSFGKNTFGWKARQVRRPAGKSSAHGNSVKQHGAEIVITFSVRTCRPCPFQDQCTSSALGRHMLNLRPREPHEALVPGPRRTEDRELEGQVRPAAGVEGTSGQALGVTGMRRARYRGPPKIRLQHAFSATPLNVIRLEAYWTRHDRHPTRSSRLEHDDRLTA